MCYKNKTKKGRSIKTDKIKRFQPTARVENTGSYCWLRKVYVHQPKHIKITSKVHNNLMVVKSQYQNMSGFFTSRPNIKIYTHKKNRTNGQSWFLRKTHVIEWYSVDLSIYITLKSIPQSCNGILGKIIKGSNDKTCNKIQTKFKVHQMNC